MTVHQDYQLAILHSCVGAKALRSTFWPPKPVAEGSNEITNGLVRQDLPKVTDLSFHIQEELDEIAYGVNNRPLKVSVTNIAVCSEPLANSRVMPRSALKSRNLHFTVESDETLILEP